MEVAKVSSKGQITIPKEVREKLKLETGSKIVFLQKGDELVVRNAEEVTTPEPYKLYRFTEESWPAFRKVQEAFSGFAEQEGLETEEDVVEWIKEMRRGDHE